jgi:hypothetical protein
MNKKLLLIIISALIIGGIVSFLLLRPLATEEEVNNEEKTEIPSPDETIGQTVGALLLTADNESSLTLEEDSDNSLISYDSGEINNLINSYDENEF